MKEQLFSTIFHDLRSPLANIVSFSELLKETATKYDDKDFNDYTDLLRKESNKAIDFTDNFMEYVRAREQNELKKDIDFYYVINNCIEEFDRDIERKNISVINNIKQDTIVKSHQSILKITARNFISNAIKFTHNNGTIKINHKNNEFSISDNGMGIPQEKLSSLFTGKTSSATGTANETGNGIGLLLVKRLLDKADIKLNIDSQPSKGTTVRLGFNSTNA